MANGNNYIARIFEGRHESAIKIICDHHKDEIKAPTLIYVKIFIERCHAFDKIQCILRNYL